MTALFLEKAFWAFMALSGALITVIWRLFNGAISKDLKLQEEKFNTKIAELRSEMSQMQTQFFHKILEKTDKKNK